MVLYRTSCPLRIQPTAQVAGCFAMWRTEHARVQPHNKTTERLLQQSVAQRHLSTQERRSACEPILSSPPIKTVTVVTSATTVFFVFFKKNKVKTELLKKIYYLCRVEWRHSAPDIVVNESVMLILVM